MEIRTIQVIRIFDKIWGSYRYAISRKKLFHHFMEGMTEEKMRKFLTAWFYRVYDQYTEQEFNKQIMKKIIAGEF